MIFRRPPVSIDVGSTSVKVAQLTEARGGVRTIRFAEQALPPDFRWEIGADRAPLVAAIRSAMARAGIRCSSVVLNLPRRQVTARISPYPPAERSTLRRVVESDLSEHIPFPVDQVVMDFQSLGPSREQPGLSDVLVVAAQRDLVRQYLDLAKDLGLQVAALTVDALGLHDLARLLPESPQGMTLVVEVGARATTINVLEGTRLRLTRSIGLGGQQLTLAIRDDLGVPVETAQETKHTQGFGILDQDPRPHRTAAWLQNIQGEIRRSGLSFGPAAISRIILVGPASAVPGLAEALRSEFDTEPIRLAAPALFPAADLGGSEEIAGDCLLAIGGGLRGIGRSAWTISLIPRELLHIQRANRLRRAGIAAVALVAIAVISSYFLQAHAIKRQRARIQALQQDVREADRLEERTNSLIAERDLLRRQLEVLALPKARRYASLELLRTISEVAPQDLVITRLNLRPGQPLDVYGNAPDSSAVADLQAGLSRSRLVTGVSLDHADHVTLRNPPSEAVDFRMTVHLWTQQAPRSGVNALALREASR